MKASVGTVYTFQGKERAAVFLLLGGATLGDTMGNWYLEHAQRCRDTSTSRVYVIGDRSRWMRQDLAGSLGHRMPFGAAQPAEKLI